MNEPKIIATVKGEWTYTHVIYSDLSVRRYEDDVYDRSYLLRFQENPNAEQVELEFKWDDDPIWRPFNKDFKFHNRMRDAIIEYELEQVLLLNKGDQDVQKK